MTAATEVRRVRTSITNGICSMRLDEPDCTLARELIKVIDHALWVLDLGRATMPSPEYALADLNRVLLFAMVKLGNDGLRHLVTVGRSSLLEKGVLTDVLP